MVPLNIPKGKDIVKAIIVVVLVVLIIGIGIGYLIFK